MVFSSCMVFDMYNYYLTADSSIPPSIVQRLRTKLCILTMILILRSIPVMGPTIAQTQIVFFPKKYHSCNLYKSILCRISGNHKWLPICKNSTACTCISAVIGKSEIQQNGITE